MRMFRLTSKALQYAAAIIAAAMLFGVAAFAGEIEEHREEIIAAREILAEYLDYTAEASKETVDPDYEAELVRNITASVPAERTVNEDGRRFDLSYKWLSELVEQARSENDMNAKAALLRQADDRLRSIELELRRDETRTAAVEKDAGKQKLDEILSRKQFQKAEPPSENFIQRWIREFWEWVNARSPQAGPIAPTREPPVGLIRVLLVIVGLAVLGLLGFAVYRLLPHIRSRRAAREKADRSSRIILGEKLADDASAQTLFTEAEELARRGDLRGAVRKGYIAALCRLSDNGLIKLSANKTNRDYLRDVRPKPVFKPVSSMTAKFERHWYGEQEVTESDWQSFRGDFVDLARGERT